MKLAISSTGKNLDSQVDPRFGRCAYFIIIETDNMNYETVKNENIDLSGGVGVQSASFIVSKNVKAVLTGNCGPKAMQTLSAGGVDVFTGQSGTVKEAVERFKIGNLDPSTQATVEEKAGIDPMQGFGRCMGGTGRGMGMGRGRGMRGSSRGMGMGSGSKLQRMTDSGADYFLGRTNLPDLKKQATELQKKLKEIQNKIKNLEHP